MYSERTLPDRLLYADVIRAYAIVLVVLLHASAPIFKLYSKIDFSAWWIGNLFNALSMCAVPLFVMLSGMLLLDSKKQESVGVFFSRRFNRVVVPLIIWEVIYVLLRYIDDSSITPGRALRMILNCNAYYHLWFIKVILGLYLATPILRVYVKNSRDTDLLYFLSLWCIAVSVLPFLANFLKIQVGIEIVVTTHFTGYFIAGYFFCKERIARGLSKAVAIAIIIGAILLTAVLTAWLTVTEGAPNNYFYQYLKSPTVIIMTITTFLLLQSLPYEKLFARSHFFYNIVQTLSAASLSIYFIHVLILEVLKRGILGFTLSGMTYSPIIGIPATALLTCTASLVIVTASRKIPYVKNLFP